MQIKCGKIGKRMGGSVGGGVVGGIKEIAKGAIFAGGIFGIGIATLSLF